MHRRGHIVYYVVEFKTTISTLNKFSFINLIKLDHHWREINKAVFCLEVLIYKRLQMWRHNDVISRNEYLIFTLSESTIA